MGLTTHYLFKQYAGITSSTYDALIDRLIDQTEELIAKACRRTFGVTTYRTWYDGTGNRRLRLDNYPILSIYRVSTQVNDVLRVTFSGGTHAAVQVDEFEHCVPHFCAPTQMRPMMARYTWATTRRPRR